MNIRTGILSAILTILTIYSLASWLTTIAEDRENQKAEQVIRLSGPGPNGIPPPPQAPGN